MPTATELLDRAKGRDLTKVATQGVGAWLLALAAAMIRGVQELVTLLLLPVTVITDVAQQAFQSLVIGPLRVVNAGAAASAQDVGEFEFLGLPVSVVIVLASFSIVGWYLRRESSSNIIPGTFIDFPSPGFTDSEEDADESDA